MVQNISTIVNNYYCISCGTCVYACPKNNIIMEYNYDYEKWIPRILDNNKCLSCNGKLNCLYVCPSYDTDYSEIINNLNSHEIITPVKKIYIVNAKNKYIRYYSSSGGFIRTLSKILLENNNIDGILSIKHDRDINYRYYLFKDNLNMPNSIYHSNNFENGLSILEKINGQVLLVGLPCYITSINLLFKKKKYQHLKNKIKYSIALFCGYSIDRTNVYSFGCYNKMNVKSIKYRTGGRYRKTVISDGFKTKIFDILKPKSLSEKINNDLLMNKYLVSRGCLHCQDHLGSVADISVGDAWLPRYNDDFTGRNLVIVRNESGNQAFSWIKSELDIEEGTIEDIINSQSDFYALGNFAKKLNNYYSNRENFYYPKHRLYFSNQKTFSISLREKIAINILKPLLNKKKYNLVKFLYILIYLKKYVGYYVHKNFNYRSYTT